MTPFTAITSFNIAIGAILATSVFLKNRKNKTAVMFSVLAAVVTVWMLGLLLWQTTGDPAAATLWARISLIGLTLLGPIYLHIIEKVLIPTPRIRSTLWISYLIAATFIVLTFTPFILKNVLLTDDLLPNFGIMFPLIPIVLLVTLSSIFILLRKRHRSPETAQRLRIRTLMLATLVGALGTIGATSLWYGIPFAPALSIGIALFLSLCAYAVTTTQFFDVKTFFKQIFVYSLTIVTAALISASLFAMAEYISGPPSIVKNVIVVLAVLALLPWSTRIYRRLFTKLFASREAEEAEEISDEIKHLATLLDLEEFIEKTAVVLRKIFDTDRIAILIRASETNNVETSRIFGFSAESDLFVPSDNMLFRLLDAEGKILTTEDLIFFAQSHGGKIASEMINQQGSVLHEKMQIFIPLYSKKKLAGIVILGPKTIRSNYTHSDIELLKFFATEASVALENARIHEEVKAYSSYLQNLNSDLSKKVKDATAQLAKKNKELERANKHLEELSNLKTEFLNMASHQLRTPTTVIRGMMSMIINDEVDEKTRESFLKKIYDSANRLAALINDLLSTAYVEGGLKLTLEATDLGKFVSGIVEELSQPAEAKNIKLSFKKTGEDTILGSIDKKRLHEAIYNLVDNAIKYTPKGTVQIILDASKETWQCSVTDSGIGIKKSDLEKLFQKFFRSDKAMEVTSHGTGLGLYVVKKIVEEHDGVVSAESNGLGKGTTFTISIPKEPDIVKPLAEQSEDDKKNPSI